MRHNLILPFLTRFNYHLFRRHKLYNNSSHLSCTPFFIVGTGRNGSTLLSMILNGHSKIFIPNEQYALHYAAIRFQLYNFLIWRDKVKLVVGEFADNANNQEWDTNFNAIYKRLYALPKKERTFQKIIDEIVIEHANQKENKFTIWGDKSLPSIWFLDYIYQAYPQSKYIFLIKDGRDVVNSFHKAGERIIQELSRIENAALHWQNAIEKWNKLKKAANPQQILEVRYEDLVTDPELKVKEILLFLGMEYEEGILDFKGIVKERKLIAPVHSSLSNPINSKSIGTWEKNLTKSQLSQIYPIIKKGLKEYNYL